MITTIAGNVPSALAISGPVALLRTSSSGVHFVVSKVYVYFFLMLLESVTLIGSHHFLDIPVLRYAMQCFTIMAGLDRVPR